MTGNVRRNLAVQLVAGGPNPLVMKPKGVLPFTMGTAVNMALIGQGGQKPYAFSIIGGELPKAAQFFASISTTVMTVISISSGAIYVGMPVLGSGIASGQTIASFGTGTGGTGTYNLSISNTNPTHALRGTILLGALTGLITGVPCTAGAYTFEAQVQDSASTIFTASFEMDVLTPLIGVSVTPTPIEQGLVYSYTFSVSGATGAVTWALTSGTLPAGLSISSAGVLSGTPSTAATYSFVLKATDTAGNTLLVPETMTVIPVFTYVGYVTLNVVLIAGANYSTIATFEQPYSTYVAGGSKPYKFSMSAADLALIPWATIDKNYGTLAGTPPGPAASVAVHPLGTDAMGETISMTVNITVINPNPKIQPQQATANVGAPGPTNVNFDGIGASAVANDGTTMTTTLGANMNAPAVDVAIPANSSAVVVRKLTIASGHKVTLGSGAILRIL